MNSLILVETQHSDLKSNRNQTNQAFNLKALNENLYDLLNTIEK